MTSGGSLSAGNLLERGARELAEVGVRDARFQAELLLRHALGCTRETLLARLRDSVSAEATGHFFQLLERRRGRVPLQYVIGAQEFYGLSFHVTPAVLIPRPETEGVVEEALHQLDEASQARIADIGCGSGCLAVSLAVTLPNAEIVAVDLSSTALAIARENALRHGVASRIEFLESDLLESIPDSDLDAIVSNPPYVSDEELAALEPEVSDHEPRRALAGGPDGLSVIERLLPEADRTLRRGGHLVFEIGQGQGPAVAKLLTEAHLEHLRTAPDLAGIPRVVVARKPGDYVQAEPSASHRVCRETGAPPSAASLSSGGRGTNEE